MHQSFAAEPSALNLVDSTNRTDISKRVIFTMGGKGGVGKTSFVLALTEWFAHHHIPVKLLDLDTENKARGSLKHYFDGRVTKINIHTAAGLDAYVARLSVAELVQQYRVEKMPKRADTRRAYEVWLRHHVLPRWGNSQLTEVQARPVELWLQSLTLAPKSRGHIRGLLSVLWDFAMWRGEIPTQRNPMELVTVKGSSKRKRHARSLTVGEFQRFIEHLTEPFRTMALLCCCLGLRISECLALKWHDVDWIDGKLTVERGIVCQQVDEVKTAESRKKLVIDRELLTALQSWKQATQFSKAEDWMFASPVQIGRLPWSYDQVWRVYQKAANKAEIGGLGTHCLRHTYRTWLDSVGTPVGVQQKLMRHADIRTTMNIYGDAVTADMAEAHGKIVGLALNRLQTDCKPS